MYQAGQSVTEYVTSGAEIERMLKALIQSLENKPLNPWTLFSN